MGSRARPDLVTKPKCNAIQGDMPVLQYCPLEQLHVDESYQRSLEAPTSITLVRRIATFWDWGLCQPLYVARRADGGLYVVDGQHRLAAARLRGDLFQLPCVVRAFDSREEEAAAFVALNQERRPLTKLQIFKAAIAAGDMEAMQIVTCVTDAGLSIATGFNVETNPRGAINNIGGLQNCYRVHGVQVLTDALKVIATAYKGERLRYCGTIFPGIVALVASGKRDVNAITEFVASRTQVEWTKAIVSLTAEHPQLNRKAASEMAFARPEAPPRECAPSSAVARILPATTTWCEQCDQRVSTPKIERCADRHCSFKKAAAA